MKFSILLGLVISMPAFAAPKPLPPEQVAVVYNSSVPESKELAEFYALTRKIPASNLIGLKTGAGSTVARSAYLSQIKEPLVKHFNENGWWKMGKDQNGKVLPVDSKIRCIAMMKGIPFRISRGPIPESEDGSNRQFAKNTEASVDSELSLMGVANVPISGYIPNPYYKKDLPAVDNNLKFLMMIGRIDGPTYDHCKRMILDAADVEKEGLWGMTYLDLWTKGGGFQVGDDWIENVVSASRKSATPVVVDRMTNTFPTNYPMRHAAVYFGWYNHNRSGPFLNDKMKFQKGAIAVHIHSFSAAQLTNPAKNWTAGLIDRGAAATVANVWEPYLGLTHNLDLFYDRLQKGYTLVEAAYMSVNVMSWQNIVVGDPLYTPFKVTTVNTRKMEKDRDFKLIRYAQTKFPDPEVRKTELIKAAEKTKSGTIYEMMAFEKLESGSPDEAVKIFKRAREFFKDPEDKLRQDLHLVELERRRKNTAAAITILKKAQIAFKDLPEVKSVAGLLSILDPPAPPATKK